MFFKPNEGGLIMANKSVFVTNKRSRSPRRKPDTVNEAGGLAYLFSDEHALAQYAVTGTFGNTYYATAGEQLDKVMEKAKNCESEFIAKLAVYASEEGKMKDVPAYLLAVLAARGETELLKKVFDRVVGRNVKILLNFVQIIRSGVTGRRSFGTAVKKLIQNWLTSRNGKKLYIASVGHSDPSLADVIKMTHPFPDSIELGATIAYILDGKFNEDWMLTVNGRTTDYHWNDLPEDIRLFEMWKRGYKDFEIPDLPFRSLTNLDLSVDDWREIAENMPWNTLRMNLNMLNRKGVFDDREFVDKTARRLADAKAIKRSCAFPYNLLTAYQNTTGLPPQIQNALQDALEVATENVPALKGDVVVAIDVSGSMNSPVTGYGHGKPTVTRCVDVAALFASCVLRQNPNAKVWAFDYAGGWSIHSRTGIYEPHLNPRDSVISNAMKLSKFGGGGTDCSLPFRKVIDDGVAVDSMILISDNQSWAGFSGGQAGAQRAWEHIHRKNPGSKLVNIDIQPYYTTQTPDESNAVLNIGGFSDTIWNVIDNFFNSGNDIDFVSVIEDSVDLN